MDARNFDELAGRIEGIGQALLHLTAALEMGGAIDGRRLAQGWRRARRCNVLPAMETARRTLHELADELDAARQARAGAVASVRCAEDKTIMPPPRVVAWPKGGTFRRSGCPS